MFREDFEGLPSGKMRWGLPERFGFERQRFKPECSTRLVFGGLLILRGACCDSPRDREAHQNYRERVIMVCWSRIM